jgi:flagellar protein FlaI
MGFIDHAKTVVERPQEAARLAVIIADEAGLNVSTIFDSLLKIIREKKKISLSQLALSVNVSPKVAEFWAKTLETHGRARINYPVNMFAEPEIEYIPVSHPAKKLPMYDLKRLADTYKVVADFVLAKINIWDVPTENVKIYEMQMPEVGEGTAALLDELIEELARSISIRGEDITDANKIAELKKLFFLNAREKIKRKLPNLDENSLSVLSGILLHKMYGLGEIEIIMADNWLEEIAINGSNVPVSVFHKKYGWLKTTMMLKSEEEIYNFAAQIGRKVGRQINSLNPIMDAHLVSGDRVAATIFPISTAGNTITIRRFARNPWTIIHMIDPKTNTMSVEIAAFLWLAMQYELNIMVAGGTASGKTSVLNSIVPFIPATQRIISIEDTREISLPKSLQWNWVPLNSRKANPEGQGEVSMLDLMIASLRMRPDRIIVGEVRKRDQAEALFETMHTGHAVYATMHADNVEQVKRRLIEPPIEIPKTEIKALQLVLIQYRDRRKSIRRTLELAEILSTEKEEKDVEMNYLYRWVPRTDVFEKVNDSIRVMEELNLHTGMTTDDINRDLKEKQVILRWMLKNGIKDIDEVGQIIKAYYKNPKQVAEAAIKDRKPSEIMS